MTIGVRFQCHDPVALSPQALDFQARPLKLVATCGAMTLRFRHGCTSVIRNIIAPSIKKPQVQRKNGDGLGWLPQTLDR
jgi:hypothetical protein